MKFLIAGFGSMGRRHFRNLLDLGEQDIVFYRTHQSTLSDDELAGYPVESDLRTALSHNPDAVIISNPTAYHLDVAIPAAEMGCDLLIEKPISNSIDRTAALKQVVERTGSKVLIGFQFRFHPNLIQIKEWIDQSILGDIHYIRAHWGEYLPDWHPWEDYRKSYSARSDLGGGVLLTLCHPIDYLHWILGDFKPLIMVIGKQQTLGIDVEELVDISIEFADGPIGQIHLNYLQRPPQHTLEIYGKEGTITWNYFSGMLKRFDVEQQEWETYPLPESFSRNDLFLAEMKHFIQMITDNQAPVCTLDDGIFVQRTIDTLHECAIKEK
jgi:predicted dehydrogenase